jgi:hypothetical protein
MGFVWTNFIKKSPYTHKIAHLGKDLENLETTHTFKKACNNELICRNLISSNAKRCLKGIKLYNN